MILAASLVVPWTRLPRRSCLAFPISVWLAVAALGVTAHGVGVNFLGTFVLCFLYIGLTQPPGTGTALAPIAGVMYVGAYDTWSVHLIPRMIIALTVYILVAEILAALQESHRDLTSRLQKSAHTDALTGLANRRDLDIRLTMIEPGDLLVICDIDHFKRINDTLGHLAGDQVLADFGLAIRGSLRESDYAARLGGEEFAILLAATDMPQVAVILDRLRTRWSILQPEITFSTGAAQSQPHWTTAELLATADQALYRAKAAGRNRDYNEAGWVEPLERTLAESIT
jgi:diguanylate cyclase (GGDEF)-like protein